jgi:UDP-N-acetylmuramate--alanine ligase
VSGNTVVESAHAHGARHVHYAPTANEAVEAALREAKPGDLLLTLGAGDVSKLGEILLEGLRVSRAPGSTAPAGGRGAR